MKVTLDLTDEQVHALLAALSDAPLAGPLMEAGDLQRLRGKLGPLTTDQAYSRSLIRGLLVFAALPADGSQRALTAVASELRLSPSTTHRYLNTWRAAGVLGQDPQSRDYHRASHSGASRRRRRAH